MIFQPTIAVIDYLRNFKRLQLLPKTLILRLSVLTVFSVSILTTRLWIQNFESPIFRWEDNPAAFASDKWTRILTQNYLYALNCFLLLLPDWLCFDWSFNSIDLIRNFEDLRVIFIVIFYTFLVTVVFVGLRRK